VLEILLVIAFFSPVLVAGMSFGVFAAAKHRQLPKAHGSYLLLLSVAYGIAGAGATLVWTVVAISRVEEASGVNSGNGPLGWIVLYGPLGFAFGELCALLQWWKAAPPALPATTSVQPNPSLERP
jgi:hypothetical protein